MINTEEKTFLKEIKKSIVTYLISGIIGLIGGFSLFTISQYSKLNLIQNAVERLEKRFDKLEDKFLYANNDKH